MHTLTWLDDRDYSFPDPERALTEPNGLLAVGGGLEPARLLQAYRQGIFPWYEEGQPVLWWSPDPRMVLFPGEVHISRSLRKIIRQRRFSVSTDRAFERVIEACAQKRRHESGTWITDDMRRSYISLHHSGHAHSMEVWLDDKLVGGLYGIALGKVFFGESMFSREPNASKVALVALARQLEQRGFRLIDCQVVSSHLLTLGARAISRRDFMKTLPAEDEIASPSPWPASEDFA